jgi:hypothetical protein
MLTMAAASIFPPKISVYNERRFMGAKIRKILVKILKATPEMDSWKKIYFLALFQLEDGLGDWDIVISSPHLSDSCMKSYKLVVHTLLQYLDPEEMRDIARVVIMDTEDPNTHFLAEELPKWSCDDTYLESPQHFGTSLISDGMGFEIRKIFLLRNLSMSDRVI